MFLCACLVWRRGGRIALQHDAVFEIRKTKLSRLKQSKHAVLFSKIGLKIAGAMWNWRIFVVLIVDLYRMWYRRR